MTRTPNLHRPDLYVREAADDEFVCICSEECEHGGTFEESGDVTWLVKKDTCTYTWNPACVMKKIATFVSTQLPEMVEELET